MKEKSDTEQIVDDGRGTECRRNRDQEWHARRMQRAEEHEVRQRCDASDQAIQNELKRDGCTARVVSENAIERAEAVRSAAPFP